METKRLLLPCQSCGKTVERVPSNLMKRVFCDRVCAGKANDTRVELKCDQCGATFLRKAKRVGAQNFCSQACSAASRVQRVPVDCGTCGKGLTTTRFRAERNPIFCGKACFRAFLSRIRTGSKNPMWKGDEVGYSALHDWIERRFPRPNRCQSCNKTAVLDLANISQEYRRDVTDWEWLCRRCHMTSDGRLHNLRQYHAGRAGRAKLAELS